MSAPCTENSLPRSMPRLAPHARVIIVCPGGLEHGGGIGRQMGYFLLAQAQAADGPTYQLIDSRGPWFLGSSPWHAGLSSLYLAKAALALLVARFSRPAPIVHINITGRGSTIRKLVLGATCRVAGLAYLLHVHDYDYPADYRRRGRFIQFLVRGLFRSAARIIVLGQSAKAALATSLRLDGTTIDVLHNAVPDPAACAILRAPDDQCGILFLGHLSARKGVPDLLQALAREPLAGLQWHAILAGGGPIVEYKSIAAELGIAGQVNFPGWVDQPAVSALFASSDILVLPSYAEGLAMAVLEALSYGLAVVATPVGAHEEVIEQGISGLFVEPGDIDGLAASLAQLVRDAPARHALQAGARRRFLDAFDIRSYAARLHIVHASLQRLQTGA